MSKPYLTKLAYGRWWFYMDTRRKWRTRCFRLGPWHVMVASYRKVRQPDRF